MNADFRGPSSKISNASLVTVATGFIHVHALADDFNDVQLSGGGNGDESEDDDLLPFRIVHGTKLHV